jgi:bifunctional non-homologous end joining protein LigD
MIEDLVPELRRLVRKASQPDWVPPMLATLTTKYFSDPDWIFERKLDGQRVLAFHRRGAVSLKSRNKIEINGNYPELVDALTEASDHDCVVDGEVVAFDGKQTSFTVLQPRIHTRQPEKARQLKIKIFYYIFDLLYVDGYDVTKLPLRERKRLLRETFSFNDPLRFTTHRNERGEAYHQEACEKGWEGLIAKRADGPYVSDRSKDWLKFKCVRDQELVIGGFTAPQGSREEFGSLLVGYYENGNLRYAGKVGTGYSHQTLSDLGKQLRAMERDESPFADRVREKNAHWVKPSLVGEFGFTEWTRDGKLRHPRFKGLRRDKSAKDVVRETR